MWEDTSAVPDLFFSFSYSSLLIINPYSYRWLQLPSIWGWHAFHHPFQFSFLRSCLVGIVAYLTTLFGFSKGVSMSSVPLRPTLLKVSLAMWLAPCPFSSSPLIHQWLSLLLNSLLIGFLLCTWAPLNSILHSEVKNKILHSCLKCFNSFLILLRWRGSYS